jgi:glyoxylase-like metal-dependent hydrolase (beta-lactamase superfamily II)
MESRSEAGLIDSEGIFFVPEMSDDERVRVFRRAFSMHGSEEAMEVDAYVLITDHYVVVCDTLLCPEDMGVVMRAVEGELRGRQVLVVNSHADWDHAWGNCYFTGEHAAPILAHSHGFDRLKSDEALVELKEFQEQSPTFRSVMLTPASVTFEHTLTIHGGDLTIELLPAPGHHSDHIAAWIPEIRLLLAFDAVENPIPCLHDAAGVQPMFTTLESFLALHPQRVLCSHGKTTSVDMVKKNLAYLCEIERRCRTFLTTHSPTATDLEDAAAQIHYPFDEVIAGSTGPVDQQFYSDAHNTNVRCVLEWLLSM